VEDQTKIETNQVVPHDHTENKISANIVKVILHHLPHHIRGNWMPQSEMFKNFQSIFEFVVVLKKITFSGGCLP